jgi:hypothetical protein
MCYFKILPQSTEKTSAEEKKAGTGQKKASAGDSFN